MLLEAGLNLAGIALVLELQDDNERLRAHRRPWLRLLVVATMAA